MVPINPIYGLTQCHHVCDEVYLYLYLERKVNGSYGTYKSWKFESNNATSLSRGLNVIVPSGTYYRVRGYHAAKDSWKFESNNATSLSRGLNVIVPSGTYYRVRGYHAAKDGSKESTSTLTSGILIK